MVTEKIQKTIKTHNLIKKGAHIVIGLSGGPDSVCLFGVLHDLSKDFSWTLHAVHVNHKFRPGAAEEDQQYVKNLCEERDVDCKVFVYDCTKIAEEEHISAEQAGRQARYEAFSLRAEELMNQGISPGNIKIAVAHNYNDQAETVLLRIMRGTGVDGLAGMEYSRKNRQGIQIIRPLLDVERKEIEAYCKEKGLNPQIDKTNLESLYTRNKIRLELIPFIDGNFDTNITDSLNRIAKIAAEDSAFIKTHWDKAFSDCLKEKGEDRIVLEAAELSKVHSSIKKRVIKKAFEEIGLVQDITESHLSAAEELTEKRAASRSIDFPKGYSMKIRYGDIIISRNREENPDESKSIPKVNMKVSLKEYSAFLQEKTAENPGDNILTAFFDWEAICNSFCTSFGRNPKLDEIKLRTREAGDFFSLGEQRGRKKLQDFFVDNKVPGEMRDQIPLVALGKEILWVISSSPEDKFKNRYSGKYKTDRHTKTVLAVEIYCEVW